MKNESAKTPAKNITFLCPSTFLFAIRDQPIATNMALITIKLVLIVGKIGNEFKISTPTIF
jgi:hypothetical protein